MREEEFEISLKVRKRKIDEFLISNKKSAKKQKSARIKVGTAKLVFAFVTHSMMYNICVYKGDFTLHFGNFLYILYIYSPFDTKVH